VAVLFNCTFWGNSAVAGGGLFYETGSGTLVVCQA